MRQRGTLVKFPTAGPVVVGLAPAVASVADIYVAPTGSDNNPGTLAAPLLTIDAARQKANSLAATVNRNVVVMLRGGTYYLAAQLKLTAADSGRNGHRIVYCSYPGESPIISGGQVVSGWTVFDAGKGVWSAPVTLPGGVFSRNLFVNGIRATRARRGALPGGTTVTGSGYTTAATALSGTVKNVANIEMLYRWEWTEARVAVASLSGVTITMQTIFPKIQGAGFARGNLPTAIENIWEDFYPAGAATAGTHYYDLAAHVAYYVPRNGETLSTATVVMPWLTTLVSMVGCSNITFFGIQFSHTTWLQPLASDGFLETGENARWTGVPAVYSNAIGTDPSSYFNCRKMEAAVEGVGCTGIRFERCIFSQLGGAGLNIGLGGNSCIVRGNVFKDISGTGYYGGDPGTCNNYMGNGRNRVDNNVVHDVGAEFPGAAGICAFDSAESIIAHNLVHHVPYNGIAVGGDASIDTLQKRRANQIIGNEVHHYMQTMLDGGGVYLNGSQPGTVISGNSVHDGPASQGQKVHGFYFDDGSNNMSGSGNFAFNNLFAEVAFFHDTISGLTLGIMSDVSSVVNFPDVLSVAVPVVTVTEGPTAQCASLAAASGAGLTPAFADLINA